MKQLAMLRHAKSDWGNPGLTDFDRPLNKRGRKAAKKIGRTLREQGLVLGHVVSSPAARAKETVEQFGLAYEQDVEVRFEPGIYLASTGTLLEIVEEPDGTDPVMIVGHNPGFHDIVLRLTKEDGNGNRAKVGANFPTGAFALIDFPAETWADVEPGTGEIRQVIFPREI